MEYESTKYLEEKSYFRVTPYERNNKGNIRAMYKDAIKT